MIKTKVAFWRAGFYPANQSNVKINQKALIGWEKAGPLKKATFVLSCKPANRNSVCYIESVRGNSKSFSNIIC